MRKRMAGAILAGVLALVALLRASAQQQPAPASQAATQPASPALIIGPGDLIDVGIFDTPELTGRFRVDHNGDVELPLLGIVHVSGLTAVQAAKMIENRYIEAEILQSGTPATVYIEEYANQGITVSGEVKNAGIYPAFGVRMLNDVVTAAGGVTLASASEAIITRRDDPHHPATVVYNPQALPPVVPDLQVFPGDTVLIPRAGIVYVLGNVNKAGGFVLDGSRTLTAEAAIALAGGEARFSALKKTQLVRTLNGGRREVMTVPLDLIFKGKAPDVALQDGDILYVPTSSGKMATSQAITAAIGIGTAITIYKTAYQ